ncbi:SULTR1B [Auxenochlorella protothecoides x Auxenochlorella symbiontica]
MHRSAPHLHTPSSHAHIPSPRQGAIIIVGVLQLFDWREGARLFRVSPSDFLVWLTAFLTVALVGVEWGICASAALSVAIMLARVSFPAVLRLGRLPGTNYFRPLRQYRGALAPRGYILFSIAAPVCFASIEHIRTGLKAELDAQEVAAEKDEEEPLQFVVLDLSASPTFDAAAVQWIDETRDELEGQGISLVLANPSQQVLHIMKRAGLVHKLGVQNIQADVMDAILYVEETLRSRGCMV